MASRSIITMATFVVVMTTMMQITEASLGDKTYVFQKCMDKCKENCHGTSLQEFRANQPMSERLLQWSCTDECKYSCMWVTVDAFAKDGMPIPQFYGKWPFVRAFGVQEPASMIASILNGLGHLSILRYRKLVAPSTPMYYVWHGAALTAMNAWFWSTIFHSKDTNFTEKMDYFSAFSIVLYSTFSLACRVLGTVHWKRPLLVGVCCVLFYAKHVHFLAFDRFDYGYNMKVNIAVAVFNMIGWLAWCIWNRRRRYVWKGVAAIVLINCMLSLELLDFEPLWWTFDAHSLWHFGTAPLCLLWYSFVIDDGKYLMSVKQSKNGILPEKVD